MVLALGGSGAVRGWAPARSQLGAGWREAGRGLGNRIVSACPRPLPLSPGLLLTPALAASHFVSAPRPMDSL